MTFPFTRASFNLTRDCNFRCTYPCFTHGCRLGSMSLETAKKCIDFLFNEAIKAKDKRDKMVEVSFWGGEPLLEWQLLKDMVLYSEDKSKETGIPVKFGGTTNGSLFTPEKFDFLDEHKIFFMISFDGTQETQDYHRKTKEGLGSHTIVERNIRKVLEKWPFYRIRMSPFAERIDHFFEDMKYIFDLGCDYIMFSPVYESNWTEEKWLIWEDQCKKVIDYMVQLKASGRNVQVEHFKSYVRKDNSRWPCGMGRFYGGFDIDGSIYLCHRCNKFDDNRPWQEKELCIGHVDVGFTRPEVRDSVGDNWDPQGCSGKECYETTPCHGGCPALNYDFTGKLNVPYSGLCRYVQLQKRVSAYYKEKGMVDDKIEQIDRPKKGCMPYQGSNFGCECYNTRYNGPVVPPKEDIRNLINTLGILINDLNTRLSKLEKKNDGVG